MAYEYETIKIPYVTPPKNHKYTPDIILPNGIIVELKGRLLPLDRQKHTLIRQQCPDLDIRFVFQNSRARINKRSTTTYGDWAKKSGIQYADKSIPSEWIAEPPKKKLQ